MSRKNLNRNKSGRGNFNAIDVAIILLIVLCVVGIYFRYDVENKISEGEGASYEVKFVCEKARYTTSEYISSGEVFYFTDGMSTFGVLQEMLSPPAVEEVVVNGKCMLVSYPYDTLVDINGTLKVNGTMTDNGFLVAGNTYIAPNSVVKISNKFVDLEIRILSIKPTESK